MRGEIRFVRSGRVVRVSGSEPTVTVLDYLRSSPGNRGSKEGCAEGDCGACTVVLGERDGSKVCYRAYNSCILFLPAIDGKELLTVENLAGDDLHPVQQAMVEEHGSQCGFCTPGFITSMFALYQENPESPPDRHTINLALAGNLCRCTGYAPIVRAAQAAMPGGRGDAFSKGMKETAALLESLETGDELCINATNGVFHAPQTLERLAELMAAHPEALLVAGATDVGLWVTKQLRSFARVIYTGRVAELREIKTGHEVLTIGAAATYTDAMQAITVSFPQFREVLERLGGLQVRNAGTIGGNIANGSPIADMPPGLIALGARLVLNKAGARRVVELEDFFLDYGRQDLQPGEFLERIEVPLEAPSAGVEQLFRTWKISKRFEQDISAVCGAFAVALENGHVLSARVAFGGMAAIPRRAFTCEEALTGKPWNEETIASAMRALDQDFEPISDMRASESYRRRVAANLLLRLFLESQQPAHPTRLGNFHEPA